MGITIKNCHIENCGVGISTDNSINLDISGTSIVGCRKAIELRDKPGVLQSIGLPANTPPELLIEALTLLLNYKDQETEPLKDTLLKTKLFNWLDGTANVATILTSLLSLQQNELIQGFLQIFK